MQGNGKGIKIGVFRPYLALFRKQYKMWPYLQWNTNRKSYAIYRMVPFPMTVSNPQQRFQGHGVIFTCRCYQRIVYAADA